MRQENITIIAFVLVALASAGCSRQEDPDRRRVGVDSHIDISQGESAVCGSLSVGVVDSAAELANAAADVESTYNSIFVADEGYSAMEDNDIRGYLDGAFKEGWNQVGQSHLRLGRRGRNPAFGEFELFRNLHRWANLELPADIQVVDAKLELVLESGPPFAVDVAVYAVTKDWNPGNGGTNKDNNSPPAHGEVWWVDAMAGKVSWHRAGAGFASDDHPDADTGAQPLAITRYSPNGPSTLSFRSQKLASYIEDRLAQNLPLLFLYKQTDVYEDSIGSSLEIWSSNFGTDGSARRPSLSIDWKAPGRTKVRNFDINIEHGRFLELGSVQVGGKKHIAASFRSVAGAGPCAGIPWLEYRIEESGSDWRPLNRPMLVDAEWVAIRASAATHPIALGRKTMSSLRDTWIPKGKVEDHVVHWTFWSPDGRKIDRAGEYAGDYTWQVGLPADTIGRWRYDWHHSLSGKPVHSESMMYDVVAWEADVVMQGLKDLRHEIGRSDAEPKSYEMIRFELSFMRLQRAAMLLPMGPEPAYTEDLRVELRLLRELLSGKEVPETFEPKSIRAREAQ